MKQEYTLEDLLQDTSFHQWVHQSNARSMRKWELWLEQYPENQKMAFDAAMLIKGVSFRKQLLKEEVIHANWEALQKNIQSNKSRRFWLTAYKYHVAAAIAMLLLTFSAAWFYFQNQPQTFTTGYGEIQMIALPDGSKVTLNANSTLAYHHEALLSQERTVYLQGEAYFEVVQKQQPARFVVMMENAQVEVLGTKFNVNNRRHKTQVVLNSGKVQFHVPDKEHTTLQPGEKVEYDTQIDSLTLEKVDPALYSSWKNKKLKFDDTSLTELAQLLEDNYGVEVRINDNILLDKRITGEISAQNLTLILKAVSRLFNIQVTRSGNIVYFS